MSTDSNAGVQIEPRESHAFRLWRRWLVAVGSLPFVIAGFVISLWLNAYIYAFVSSVRGNLPASAWSTYTNYRILAWVILPVSLLQLVLVILSLKEGFSNRAAARHRRKWIVAAIIELVLLAALTTYWAKGMLPTVQLIHAVESQQ